MSSGGKNSVWNEALLFLPFVFSQILYWFIWYIPKSEPGLEALIIKCIPVSSLALYVQLHDKPKNEDSAAFVKLVTIGLIFSVIGDGCLVWDELFIPGMLAFGVAQMAYIKAFGWGELKWVSGIVFYATAASVIYIVLPGIDDPVVKIALPIYGMLLVTMAWRAYARANSLLSAMAALGGVVFLISDVHIAVHKFFSPLSFFDVGVMSTYYASQFLLTLSATELFLAEDATPTRAKTTPKKQKKRKHF